MPKSASKGSKKGSPRVALLIILESFSPLVASGGQNGAQGFVMAPFYPHLGSNFTQTYKKMVTSRGKKAKHIQENFGPFVLIGGRSVVFFITWERKLHIYKKTSVRF